MREREDKFSFLNFVNSYSIWVALGSFISFLFFSKIFQVPLNYVVAISLSLSVWIIYTLDHLFDGLVKSGKKLALRHRLHVVNSGKLLYLLVASTLTVIILSFYIDSSYYYSIFLLTALTILHFLVNYLVPNKFKRKVFLKELTIAFVVSVGFCYLPSISAEGDIRSQLLLVFLAIFLINLANLLAFSFYDKELDLKTDTLSAASFASENTILNLIRLTVIVSTLLSFIGVMLDYYGIIILLVLLAMQSTLFFLTLKIQYFKKNDRYRFFGDLIYLYPMISLPFLG